MAVTIFDAVLVDDARDVRTLVKRQLQLSGRFNVVGEGASGREAVELAAQHHPALLLLDASMPDIDGLTAIPGILAASPTTRVVMFSGFDAASLRDLALERGAVDYIEKSTPIRELPGRLLAALDADRVTENQPDPKVEAEVEAVLAAHLERFRTVFDQAAIGMATLTLSGTIVRANQALSDVLHKPESELVGTTLASVAHEAERAEVDRAVRRASAHIGATEIEHRLDIRGEDRWAHTTVAAVRDAEDRPLYLFAQLEDVTSQHVALDQLRNSEERFRLMVESVKDYAIFMLDTNGIITTWNLGAQRLKGYNSDEIVGRHFSVFYPEEQRASGHPEHELVTALRDGRYEEEGWRVRKDGSTFWASVVITALYDDGGKHFGFAKVTRDMTERRAAETAREDTAARLVANNEELHAAARQTEEFLAVTAHELQSPIAAINGAAEILEDYWDKLDVAERLDTLARVTAGGRRIRRLLDDLLTASRLDAGTFAISATRVLLADVVDDALREVTDVADAIEIRGLENLYVHADAARVGQIITNLFTNAAKYGAAPYTVEAVRRGEQVELRVSDDGAGPPEHLQAQLFDKFSKDAQASVRGTGLGLFIVRELARMQGGNAWYEAKATFVLSLPAAD